METDNELLVGEEGYEEMISTPAYSRKKEDAITKLIKEGNIRDFGFSGDPEDYVERE